MLYYFFALLAAAVVLLASNIRSATDRWAAFFLGFVSIGGLSDTLAEAGLNSATHAIEFLNLTVTPYGVLMFAIVYSGLLERSRKRLTLYAYVERYGRETVTWIRNSPMEVRDVGYFPVC